MAHGDARGEKWRGSKRMEWVTSKRHMTAEHRLARAVQTLQAGVHSSPASRRPNWCTRRFKWTRPFCRKTKSSFCACAITFQTQSTSINPVSALTVTYFNFLTEQRYREVDILFTSVVYSDRFKRWLDLRRFVAGISPRRPEFHPRPIHVGFVVDELAIVQVLLRVLGF